MLPESDNVGPAEGFKVFRASRFEPSSLAASGSRKSRKQLFQRTGFGQLDVLGWLLKASL